MPKARPPKNRATHHVGEARVAYRTEPPKYDSRSDFAHVTLSSKNQITLPVSMVRALDLDPGDQLTLSRLHGEIVLTKRLYGRELMATLAGSLNRPEWSTDAKIDEWLRIVREGGELP